MAPATVTLIGGANSGKSTLVNCLVERSILPQNVTCETSVLTHLNLRNEVKVPFMSVRGRVLATGPIEINQKIKSLSEEMRQRSPESQEMTDVAVFCAPTKALKDIGDGTLNVLDIPGCDEEYNPIVKDMLKFAASLSDVVMVIVPHETIGTESFAKLLDALEQDASHVMKPRMNKRMEVRNDFRFVFVISKCDIAVESAVNDSVDDESEEQCVAGVIAKLMAVLRAILDRRWGQNFVVERLKAELRDILNRRWGKSFPHAAKAPIFAVSARNLLHNRRRKGSKAEFDWPQVEEFLRSIHRQSAILRVDRKLQQASRVINLMHEKIKKCEGYPVRAKRVIAEAEADFQAQKHAQVKAEWMRNVAYSSAAIVGIGLCLGGGWVAVAAFQASMSATAAAAAATGQAAAAWLSSTAAVFTVQAAVFSATAAGTAVSIGGAAVVVGSSVGAVGAKRADATIKGLPLYENIKRGEKYEDTLIDGKEVSGKEVDGKHVSSGEEVNDEEVSGAEVSGTEANGTEVSGKEASGGGQVSGGGEVSGKGVSGEEVSGEEVNGEEVNGDEVSGEEVNGKEISGDNVNGEEVIYVGEFVGETPHGSGKAFWSNSVRSESIIGEFEHGRFHKGMVLDERAAVIGNFLVDEIEGLVLDGMQPDDQIREDPICAICCERSALWTESRCFDKCFHGMCCGDCATQALKVSANCPFCQREVKKIIKFA